MEDNKQYLESGIARSQIEAARKKLSRNENLSNLQEENISYLNEMITGATLVLFVVFLVLYFYFGIDTFAVLGILLVLTGILILQTVKRLRNKLRIRASREQDLSKYEK